MKNINILHIEDDLSDAILIKKLLEQNNKFSKITNVTKLSEGLSELQNNEYDVVLLDLSLQDVKGMDNLICIKEENSDIPIIVLTGHNDDKTAQQALIQGAQEYLFKGQISSDILNRVISSSILRKAAENELNRQLHFNPLTEIPNRLFFRKIVDLLINKTKRRKSTSALFFMDLDGFKLVNDTYGHN